MDNYLTQINPIYLSLIVLLTVGVIIFGVKFTLNQAEKFFDRIEKRLDKTDKRIILLFIEQDSTDHALDKCLPSNGMGFLGYKKEKKTELISDEKYVNNRFG